MKKRYYVSKLMQRNGDHEVHDEICRWLPKVENRIYLGEFQSCHDAVRTAKDHYSQTNGCINCCRPCHTQ
jgi:hypothetical protein